VVSINIAEQTGKFLKGRGIDSAMFFEAVVGTRAELVERPASFCNPDNRHIEVTAVQHCLQRGKYLLVGQVAGCTEKDQRVGVGICHNCLFKPFWTWYRILRCVRRIDIASRTRTSTASDPAVVRWLSGRATL